MYLRSENLTSGAPTNPVGAYKGGLGACCAACASGAKSCQTSFSGVEISTSSAVAIGAALVGVFWVMSRRGR